jgi:putative oxidoreductase
MNKLLARAEPFTYQLLRIAVGLLFAFHGAQKLFGLFGGQRVALISQFGAAGVIELVGGLLIAAGVAVSPVAFICSGEMAFAYFQAHFPRAVVPIQNGGELSALYCFTFLYFAARGRN